jgi:hypothetical protein
MCSENKAVSRDLLDEREKCTFDQNELRIILFGGPVIYNNLMKH